MGCTIGEASKITLSPPIKEQCAYTHKCSKVSGSLIAIPQDMPIILSNKLLEISQTGSINGVPTTDFQLIPIVSTNLGNGTRRLEYSTGESFQLKVCGDSKIVELKEFPDSRAERWGIRLLNVQESGNTHIALIELRKI